VFTGGCALSVTSEKPATTASGPEPVSEIDAATRRLMAALDGLERAVERRRDADRDEDELAARIQALGADRSRLADELDGSLVKTRKLERVNREIAERLDAAIGTIRAVLDESRIGNLRGKFGEIGDARLTVMAALTVCDELVDASNRIRALEQEVISLRDVRVAASDRVKATQVAVANALNAAAERIEKTTQVLNRTVGGGVAIG